MGTQTSDELIICIRPTHILTENDWFKPLNTNTAKMSVIETQF